MFASMPGANASEPGDSSDQSNSNRVGIVRLLLERGANPDLVDSRGFTALLHAISARRSDVVGELIARGARIDSTPSSSVSEKPVMSAILLATARRCLPCLETLLNAETRFEAHAGTSDRLMDASILAADAGFVEGLTLLASHSLLPIDRTGRGGLGLLVLRDGAVGCC
jgi:hypothetical protein